jgi:RND family efflux transporter MFP subunit
MSRNTKLALKVGLPILILVAAGGLTATLMASREAPEQSEPEEQAALVETRTVERREHRLDVRASGTVIPARQVQLQPQVSGKIVDVHPAVEPGGLVDKGEQLVQIDRSDYQLAVEQREAAVEQASAQLEREKGKQQVAQREWELFKEEAEKLTGEKQDPSLALRKPQLMSARAQVESAKSQLESARLNLERTSIEAPFDALVRDQSAEVGQVAGTQGPVATLVSTETFRVRLSMASDKIPQIDIPNVNAEKGSEAMVYYEVGDQKIEREARVMRLLGDLDPAGRMARVLVEIVDPLGLENIEGDAPNQIRGMPLLLDAYVDVQIEGNETRELIEIPRKAVRNGYQAYVVDDGKLAVEEIEIVWRRPDTVLVSSGLEDGERVVTGPLPNPVEGMPLKIESGDEAGSGSDRESAGGPAGGGESDSDSAPGDGNESRDQAPEPGAGDDGGEEAQ